MSASRTPNTLVSRLRSLMRDRRGIAALEFALITPLLLSMYFVTMEVSQGIETNKKVSRVGSMVADLVTQQQQSTTKAEIDAIMSIGQSTLQPYNRSTGSIVVTAIEITNDNTPKVQVVWSRQLVNGNSSAAAAKGDPATVPETLKIKGSFLIRVESKLSYKPVLTWAAEGRETLGLAAAFDNIPMGEVYYLRPRMSQTITCGDC